MSTLKARLIQSVDGELVTTELTGGDLVAAMEARGFALAGLNRNPSQRAELQGVPKFSGVCGPMWDGDGVRYEDPEAYAELST
jgi:hypothetical protein